MKIYDVVKAIAAAGTQVTFVVSSSPGCGKSSILGELQKFSDFDGYEFIYVDCPTMDVPDIQLPYVKDGVAKFATNSLWGVENNKPKVIMLDELPKSSNITRLLFTRLLLEHQIGAYKLPEGSIVFGTGNRSKDGVGDVYPAHMMNRITEIQMDKPTADEWCTWGNEKGIDPIMLAWVSQFPHCLEEDVASNPYIFNTKTNTTNFVSPRSLAKASAIISKRQYISLDNLVELLTGTLGKTAALDIMAYIELADHLPKWSSIFADPSKALAPTKVGAQLILAYGAGQAVVNQPGDTKANVTKVVEYFNRLPLEVTAVAYTLLAATPSISMQVLTNPSIGAFIKENGKYFTPN